MSYTQDQLTLIEGMKTQSMSEMLMALYAECERQGKTGGFTPVDMPVTYMGPDYKEGLEGIAQRYTDTIDMLRMGKIKDAIELWNEVTTKKFPVDEFKAQIKALEMAFMISIAGLFRTNPLAGFMTTCRVLSNHLDKMQSTLN